MAACGRKQPVRISQTRYLNGRFEGKQPFNTSGKYWPVLAPGDGGGHQLFGKSWNRANAEPKNVSKVKGC